MVKYGIKIFARIKPTKKSVGLYEVEEEAGPPKLSFVVPRSEASGFVNNKKETYSFRFNKVFEQTTTQDEVFENVAQGVIDNCLEGYNGTIFAYGQTGSGKTFTITGGVEKYSDRGIIPRCLSYLFQQFQKSPGTIHTTHISYMEIYNERGYDLLDPKHEASKLEELPKVSLMEDGDGNIHMKNLSLHPATNEEESLNWLFLGDTNRMIAETPMNMASTRSHCIFTIHVTSREPGSDTIKRAKLHLVDLAGSERISKTGVSGTLLSEAKYINVSLHFLEQVIVALSEKSRSHIPYRNSMMTSVLRDSLGGNCMTTMIATCSVEKKNIDESISTCRFAQRVALVKNEATLNEELDPKLMVARLKQQVLDLKDELSLVTGEERTDDLTDEEKEKCKMLVEQYIREVNPECRLVVGGDMRMIQLCFSLLKMEILKALEGKGSVHKTAENRDSPLDTKSEEETSPESEDNKVVSDGELQRLRELLKQRDDEISVLLKMLKQEKRRAADAEATLKRSGGVQSIKPSSPILGRTSPLHLEPGAAPLGDPSPVRTSSESNQRESGQQSEALVKGGEERRKNVSRNGGRDSHASRQSQESAEWKAAMRAELSQARQEAFDTFRRSIADMSNVDKHKKVLKAKYAEAKSLGERVNTCRVAINQLKSKIEKQRISRGVQGLTDGSSLDGPDPREEELKSEIEKEKASFKHMYGHLRDLKTEIEHIQHLHEKAKMQVQRDFEQWWDQQTGQGKDDGPSSAKSAWRTPPSSVTASHLTSSKDSRPSTSSSNSSQSRGRSRHSQRILAAKFSGTDTAQGHSNGRPPSSLRKHGTGSSTSEYVGHSGIDATKREQSLNCQSLSMTDNNPGSISAMRNSDVDSIGISAALHSSTRNSSLQTIPSINSSTTSGVSSLGPVTDDSVSFTGYKSKDRQPDSLKSDRLTSYLDSHTRGVTNERFLSHQRPLFDKNKTSPNKSELESDHSSIPLTGDPRADADIIAFYKARQRLIQKGQPHR